MLDAQRFGVGMGDYENMSQRLLFLQVCDYCNYWLPYICMQISFNNQIDTFYLLSKQC